MNVSSGHRGHSADVSMELLLNGVSLRIAQMGSDFLLVEADAAHTAGAASILMRVDASERRWDVYLPQGIAAGGLQEVVIALPEGSKSRQDSGAPEMAKR